MSRASPLILPPRDIWTPRPTWARPRAKRRRSRWRWLDKLMQLPTAFGGCNIKKCCCSEYFRAKKCVDDSYSTLWVGGPISGTVTFRHTDKLCYYVSDSHESSSSPGGTIVTPGTTYDDCADCRVYRQAIRCSNGTTADAWLPEDELSLPTPYYFWKSGIGCAAFLPTSPSSATPGTILTGQTTITGCSDASPPGGDCVTNLCCTDGPFITSFIATISGMEACECAESEYELTSGTIPNGTHTLSIATGNCGYRKVLATLRFDHCTIPNNFSIQDITLRCGLSLPFELPQINLTNSAGGNCAYFFNSTEIATLCSGGTVSGTLGGTVCDGCTVDNYFWSGPISFSVTRGN